MAEPLPYDLFISYAADDRAWVEGYLLDALRSAGVRCHSEAAFALGVPRLLEFERAVQQSGRTLLVLSPAYLADDVARLVELLAQSYGLEAARWPVIPLILAPVRLPPRLALLTQLDATEPERWPQAVARLCAEVRRPLPAPAAIPECPYPGMAPFGEDDQARFFGREAEVQELLELLRLHPFLAVIGPSGSGKSSLVFAGLLPALRSSRLFGAGGWLVCALRPGEQPLAALATALGGDPSTPAQAVAQRFTAEPGARRLLLIVDQFEELYALGATDAPRFQELLLELARTPGCYVVLTVRADFYADLMASSIWPAVKDHRLEVVPLDEAGLRAAITRPAEQVGVSLEPALVERLLRDATGEPGVLPLIQETLVLLWARLERRFLPLAAYEALVSRERATAQARQGQLTGLQVAMARRADQALSALAEPQRALARRIFLRLVQFGEGRADTRRQLAVADLRAAADDLRLLDQTLEQLIGVRLLTASAAAGEPARKVDIAHEALIAGWPQLQGWLHERREAEQTRRRLEDKAAEWVRLGRGAGGLLDAIELGEAERWLASTAAVDLGYAATLPALIGASRAAVEAEAEQRRRARRFQQVALGAIVTLVIAALAVGLLSAQRNAAQQAAAAATAQALTQAETSARATAEARRAEAERQTRIAKARQLAAQAEAGGIDFRQRSLLLGVEAVSQTLQVGEAPVPDAQDALYYKVAETQVRGLSGDALFSGGLAVSGDDHWLAAGNRDGSVQLWDLRAAEPAATEVVLEGHSDGVQTVVISADSRWLVTASWDGMVRLWDLRTIGAGAQPVVLDGHEGMVLLTISVDSRWLVTASWDGMAWLWDLTGPDPEVAAVLHDDGNAIKAVAFSEDGRWLATGSSDGGVRLWNLRAADPSADPIVLRGHAEDITSLAISADSRWLVTGSADTTARMWDLWAGDPGAQSEVLRSSSGVIRALAISPDSRWLVTISSGSAAWLWDLALDTPSAQPVVLRDHMSAISAIAISADSRWLATGSWDATVRLWDLQAADPSRESVVLRGEVDEIGVLGMSTDGQWLATDGVENTVQLWNLRAADPSRESVVLRGHSGVIEALAISRDSRWLATGGGATVRLWPLRLPELIEQACRAAGRNLTSEEWALYMAGQGERRATCPSLPLDEAPGVLGDTP